MLEEAVSLNGCLAPLHPSPLRFHGILDQKLILFLSISFFPATRPGPSAGSSASRGPGVSRPAAVLSSTAPARRTNAVAGADDLARFEAELAELEGAEADDREGSPPPEDRTFVDDDGTTYVWDSSKRSYVPQVSRLPWPGSSW